MKFVLGAPLPRPPTPLQHPLFCHLLSSTKEDLQSCFSRSLFSASSYLLFMGGLTREQIKISSRRYLSKGFLKNDELLPHKRWNVSGEFRHPGEVFF